MKGLLLIFKTDADSAGSSDMMMEWWETERLKEIKPSMPTFMSVVVFCSLILYSISHYSICSWFNDSFWVSDVDLSLAIIVYITSWLQLLIALLWQTTVTYTLIQWWWFIVFLLLCSFGWTAMLAYRFRSSHSQTKKLAPPPVDMWVVWTVPLKILSITILLTAAAAAGFITSEKVSDHHQTSWIKQQPTTPT